MRGSDAAGIVPLETDRETTFESMKKENKVPDSEE